MKILITGASGLLGKSLYETVNQVNFLNSDLPVAKHDLSLAHYRNRISPNPVSSFSVSLDIRDRDMVFDLFEIIKPNVVIHCASVGSVDWTEDHYHEVRKVNISGLDNIIDACNGYKSKLVYISTNAVFSGDNPPYNEQSPLEPVNSYGIIKKDAESLVQREANKWLIFRPFMLYGWPYPGGRTNWAKSIIEALSVKENYKVIKLVDDTIWQPTYAPDCAKAIWRLLHEEGQIYNVAAPERSTLYEFGLKVCDAFGLEKNWLKPVASDCFQSIAKRPVDTSYDLKKLSELGIMLSDIKTGLKRMKDER